MTRSLRAAFAVIPVVLLFNVIPLTSSPSTAGASSPSGFSCLPKGSANSFVLLKACHNFVHVGTGFVTGGIFHGATTGTFTWNDRGVISSTTVTGVTTVFKAIRGYCNGGRGFFTGWDISGTISANTNPFLAVGGTLSGRFCLGQNGAVKGTSYGRTSDILVSSS